SAQAFSQDTVRSFESAMASTRGGLGGIYVKAAGNNFEGDYSENCSGVGCSPANNDPQNHLFNTITVAAVSADGKKSSYSSTGSALWVSAFGGGAGGMSRWEPGTDARNLFGPTVFDPAILTTDTMGCDVGNNKNKPWENVRNLLDTDQSDIDDTCNYTAQMNGTSAAAPMVSGVAALMLEANPKLTYRDVKYI
ncbi:S8 family serine peptidase, partial [Luteimonas panaciterrae]|uniref:S8 family serine peptidase n=1 Tax=Luteimonas panaciterrae TaxID=363885 RepID=UPI0031BA2258